MAVNIWDVLEMEATSSARAIKRAYARQLAKHHPEDDPEGFQLVQAAYERALLIARGGKDASGDVSLALRASVEAGADAPEAAITAPAATAPAATAPAATAPAVGSLRHRSPKRCRPPLTSPPRVRVSRAWAAFLLTSRPKLRPKRLPRPQQATPQAQAPAPSPTSSAKRY